MLCINVHKVGRTPFHCSKARAHPRRHLQGCWIPHCEGLAWATNRGSEKIEKQEVGRSQKLVWRLLIFFFFAADLVSLASFHSGLKY